MTRPKVDPENRQRTANACDSCKRRKQKCDGREPCATCNKRSFQCVYNSPEQRNGDTSSLEVQPTKRVKNNESESFTQSRTADHTSTLPRKSNSDHAADQLSDSTPARAATFNQASNHIRHAARAFSDDGSTSGGDEEVENHTVTRLLEDRGRLVYMGDSALLSFLHLLRVIVETIAGPTPFGLDPSRDKIIEDQLSLPPDAQLTHQLPSKETALILVDAFFVYTQAMFQVFDEATFLATLELVYLDPLTIDHIYLCHLNLVLAIGTCLATPEEGTREAAIIKDVRSKRPNQSEVFYSNARRLNDPIVGLEDGQNDSIATLVLMAAYMMFRSKRNTAYSFIGMAVRTAYTLGMHREETLVAFPADEQRSRKRLWRSLFIMDRLLASYLGRPVAIVEEEFSGELLSPQSTSSTLRQSVHLAPDELCSAGLEATTRAAHIIGVILRKVYSKRRISTKIAQSLADECKQWPESLPTALHWRQATSKNRRQSLAILHCNLAYCHSIVLLSRPFFVCLLNSDIRKKQTGHDQEESRARARMEKFSDACIIASIHIIALVQNAYEGRYLAQIDSAAIYALMSAALIIFADKFARPSSSALSSQCMANAISIMTYCGESDPVAKRAAYVLTNFRDVIYEQEHRSGEAQRPQVVAVPVAPPYTVSEINDQNPVAPIVDQGFSALPPLADAGPYPNNGSAAIPANTFGFSIPYTDTMPMNDSFSGLLDLNNTVLPSLSDVGSSGPDEAIYFDALWGEWPGNSSSLDFGAFVGVPAQGANAIFAGGL